MAVELLKGQWIKTILSVYEKERTVKKHSKNKDGREHIQTD